MRELRIRNAEAGLWFVRESLRFMRGVSSMARSEETEDFGGFWFVRCRGV